MVEGDVVVVSGAVVVFACVVALVRLVELPLAVVAGRVAPRAVVEGPSSPERISAAARSPRISAAAAAPTSSGKRRRLERYTGRGEGVAARAGAGSDA